VILPRSPAASYNISVMVRGGEALAAGHRVGILALLLKVPMEN
jgi:hypothetical protein